MQYQTEILRFKEGARNRHPSPEATVAAAQPNVLSDAGHQLAVLVDLMPQLPYRSREIRSLVVKTYWTSSGSIVARLRRALAAANRHLISFNQRAQAGNKCAGSITCAVFSNNELFLGQVGAAYAYISHPPALQQTNPGAPDFEIFPRRDRLLMPLGSTVPPIIHIAYTVMVPGSIACIATTRVAEALARETWQQTLALAKLGSIANELSRTFASRKISGGAILFNAEASPIARSAPWARPRPTQRADKRRPPTTAAASLTPIPSARRQGAQQTPQPATHQPPHTTATQMSVTAPGDLEETTVARTSQQEITTGSVPPAQIPMNRQAPGTATAETAASTPPPKSPRHTVKLPQLQLPKLTFSLDPLRNWIIDAKEFRQQRRHARLTGVTERTTTAEHARLRLALRTLLPGKINSRQAPTVHTPPTERSAVMGGLAMGFLLVVLLITLTKYFQLGGASRAEILMADAMKLQETAIASQEATDWYTVRDAAAQILRLDPENVEAHSLEFEAQQAIDMMENAAMLSVTPLLELGTAPSPRRMLIADSSAYVLNTATDAVVAYPLSADGRTLLAENPIPILQRGQTFLGEVVNHLVDFAWIAPGNSYPDGAVFIYSEGGSIFIYEPGVRPGGISVQHIEGDLQPGNITMMENYGENFYLVHRQLNQILVYQPVNGIYASPETYFADGAAPDLQLVLDVAIDGRVFLLTGDGTIQSYFTGSLDTAFKMNGLPDTDFTPLVMDIDPDVTDGLIYLAETQKERIIVLDKRGEFIRQYRLPKNELQRIESLRVDQETQVIYLIAENRLYAAPMPNFGIEPTGQP